MTDLDGNLTNSVVLIYRIQLQSIMTFTFFYTENDTKLTPLISFNPEHFEELNKNYSSTGL